jgi:hypothetical protein
VETFPEKLGKEKIRLLNQSWEQFQEQLSPDSDLALRINDHPGLGALSVLTGRREFWELAVSAAGYISQHEPTLKDLTIKDVVQSVADRSWESSLPDLESYIADVCTLDLGSVVAAAPVAIKGIRLDDVTIQMIDCASGCYELYKDNPAELQKCLKGCL